MSRAVLLWRINVPCYGWSALKRLGINKHVTNLRCDQDEMLCGGVLLLSASHMVYNRAGVLLSIPASTSKFPLTPVTPQNGVWFSFQCVRTAHTMQKKGNRHAASPNELLTKKPTRYRHYRGLFMLALQTVLAEFYTPYRHLCTNFSILKRFYYRTTECIRNYYKTWEFLSCSFRGTSGLSQPCKYG